MMVLQVARYCAALTTAFGMVGDDMYTHNIEESLTLWSMQVHIWAVDMREGLESLVVLRLNLETGSRKGMGR